MSPGKGPWHPLNGRMGGLRGWAGRFGEKKNPLTLGGNEPRFLGCAPRRKTAAV